jgi:hypothetical protein
VKSISPVWSATTHSSSDGQEIALGVRRASTGSGAEKLSGTDARAAPGSGNALSRQSRSEIVASR